MTKRAILYARVSGDDRKNVTSSIDSQLTECRNYANQRGYTVVSETFEDPEKQTSGADWLPELDRLIKLAPSRTFDVLIVREVDRLARNRFKQMATEIELEDHGVHVEYVIGQFEDTDEGRLLKGLVSEVSEYERAKIRRRTYNGKLRSVESGNTQTGGAGAPYGYDVAMIDGHRVLVINEEEATVVRLIFDLYVNQGKSLFEVCSYLDGHNIPLPARNNGARKRSFGRAWASSTIRGFLDQEAYTGVWYYRKTRAIKNRKTRKYLTVPRPPEEWLGVNVPAIISQEMFAAVAKRKEANKTQKGHQRKTVYALGGMVRCANCGLGMTGTHSWRGERLYAYFRCGSVNRRATYGGTCGNVLFPVDNVERAVWDWVKSLLLDPATLRRSIEEYQEQQRGQAQPQLAMLESTQARLTKLEEQKTRLIDAYTKGVLTLDELAKQKTTLDKEISELGQAVSMLREETEPHLLSAEHIESIEAIAMEMREGAAFADDDKPAQRALFQLLDVRVVLGHDDGQRWADAACTLGSSRYVVENTKQSFGADSNRQQTRPISKIHQRTTAANSGA